MTNINCIECGHSSELHYRTSGPGAWSEGCGVVDTSNSKYVFCMCERSRADVEAQVRTSLPPRIDYEWLHDEHKALAASVSDLESDRRCTHKLLARALDRIHALESRGAEPPSDGEWICLKCPTCPTRNSEFAIRCHSCGAFKPAPPARETAVPEWVPSAEEIVVCAWNAEDGRKVTQDEVTHHGRRWGGAIRRLIASRIPPAAKPFIRYTVGIDGDTAILAGIDAHGVTHVLSANVTVHVDGDAPPAAKVREEADSSYRAGLEDAAIYVGRQHDEESTCAGLAEAIRSLKSPPAKAETVTNPMCDCGCAAYDHPNVRKESMKGAICPCTLTISEVITKSRASKEAQS